MSASRPRRGPRENPLARAEPVDARQSPVAICRLVERAAAGDERAWHRLVDQFGGLVWAVTRAHRLGDGDAADVVQSTWLRLVEHLGRLEEPARVGAWLATTARRECLRVLRGSARLVPYGDELPELADDAPAHHATLLTRERTSRCGPRSHACASVTGRSCACSWPTRLRATRRSAQRSRCPSGASARPERARSGG